MSGTTPFPNALIDDIMPHLKDTEWRLLCVIVRQTLGWQEQKTQRRKVRDWLTQSQFVKKTGRDRAAISRALDSLVKSGYIEVRSEENRLLHSPNERRQCTGRLFYGLSSHLLKGHSDVASAKDRISAKSEYPGPIPNSLLKSGTIKSEYRPAPKANTTKETGTKENDTKNIFGESWKALPCQVGGVETMELISSASHNLWPPTNREYSQAVQDFVALFEQICKQIQGHKSAVVLLPAQTGRLEKLLASQAPFNWMPVLQAFFNSDAGYVKNRNHSLPVFLDSCHIFLIKTRSVGRR